MIFEIILWGFFSAWGWFGAGYIKDRVWPPEPMPKVQIEENKSNTK